MLSTCPSEYISYIYIYIYIYQLISAECSIEGLERGIINDVRFDLAFLLLFSFVPHSICGTPQIKLPTKSSLQHTVKFRK